MLRFLLSLGIPNRLVKPLAYIGLPLLIAGLIYLAVTTYGDARYDAGVADEKAAERAREQAAEAAQREREREATARLELSRRLEAEIAAERTKEIDDATRNLPDQALSARQRARACLSLQAEAKAAGLPIPTC